MLQVPFLFLFLLIQQVLFSEGIGNVVSNDATVNYSIPLLAFSINVGNTINYSMNNFFEISILSSFNAVQKIQFTTEGMLLINTV
jgi:hypothetical protein